jgi:hypothetical protein
MSRSIRIDFVSRTTILGFLLLMVILLSLSLYLNWYFPTVVTKEYFDHYKTLESFSRIFDVDEELNIPTWFSSSLLLYAAFLLFVCASLNKVKFRVISWYWRFLSWIFIFLSMDEISGFHELAIVPLRVRYALSGYWYNSWVIVGGLFVVTVALLFIPFLLSLPVKFFVIIVLAAGVYVGGAIGVEMWNGHYLNTQGFGPMYTLLTHLEEGMEMLGVIIFIWALIEYILAFGTTKTKRTKTITDFVMELPKRLQNKEILLLPAPKKTKK